jgi:hypothetical protein
VHPAHSGVLVSKRTTGELGTNVGAKPLQLLHHPHHTAFEVCVLLLDLPRIFGMGSCLQDGTGTFATAGFTRGCCQLASQEDVVTEKTSVGMSGWRWQA